MDHVEQADRLRRLVGLQPANAVQDDVGIIFSQRWPFGECFLDSALPEMTLARGDERSNLARLAGLADCDQGDVAEVAPGQPGGLVDVGLDGLQPRLSAAHKPALQAGH